METTPTKDLVEIVRLKRHIHELKKQGRLDPIEYGRLSAQLDLLSFDLVGELHSEGLPELVNTLAQRFPGLPLSNLDPLLVKYRTEKIIKLRLEALGENRKSINGEALFGGFSNINVAAFSLLDTTESFRKLLQILAQPTNTDTEIIRGIDRFYGRRGEQQFFSDLGFLRGNIVGRLAMAQCSPRESNDTLHDYEEKPRNALRDTDTT